MYLSMYVCTIFLCEDQFLQGFSTDAFPFSLIYFCVVGLGWRPSVFTNLEGPDNELEPQNDIYAYEGKASRVLEL